MRQGCEELVDFLIKKHPRLCETVPQLVTHGLQTERYDIVGRLSTMAILDDAVVDELLKPSSEGSKDTLWSEIMFNRDATSFVPDMMAQFPRLRQAAIQPEVLLKALVPAHVQSAISLLDGGAVLVSCAVPS